MDAIAQLAQVSKRTVYNHFTSKDILFEQATLALWSRSKAAATLAFDAGQPLAEQLAQIARQSWAYHQQDDFTELSRVVMTGYYPPSRTGRGRDDTAGTTRRWP